MPEETVLEIIDRYAARYQAQLHELVDAINDVAPYIPKRRKRKLHIGLFGYYRNMGKKSVTRAITCTASLYSLGVPPELLGLDALSEQDMDVIKSVYPNVEADLRDAARFANANSPYFPTSVKDKVDAWFGSTAHDDAHAAATTAICKQLTEHTSQDMQMHVMQAAERRGFLG